MDFSSLSIEWPVDVYDFRFNISQVCIALHKRLYIWQECIAHGFVTRLELLKVSFWIVYSQAQSR